MAHLFRMTINWPISAGSSFSREHAEMLRASTGPPSTLKAPKLRNRKLPTIVRRNSGWLMSDRLFPCLWCRSNREKRGRGVGGTIWVTENAIVHKRDGARFRRQ